MIKNKRLNSMFMFFSACSLMAAGFTSQAASLQPETQEVTSIVSSAEVAATDEQMNALQTAPVEFVATAVETVEASQQKAAEEAARREQEAKEQAAREQAEREAQALREQQQALLASIIFCEAGNQPYEGQVAVGAVVMNRVNSGVYPNSIEEVIYQNGQFGPASTGWLDKVRNSGGYTATAMQAAADALAGANPVGGCLYFDKGGYGMKIGDHYFH
ncbi:cell wall hydrolase [Bariatricus sp. SGI.154]|uniref:cell wall hydrolase n=1 Tax=Bariatricus sp. SGI.154 TaxID=3420549 RepID=UPI003D08E231